MESLNETSKCTGLEQQLADQPVLGDGRETHSSEGWIDPVLTCLWGKAFWVRNGYSLPLYQCHEATRLCQQAHGASESSMNDRNDWKTVSNAFAVIDFTEDDLEVRHVPWEAGS